MDPEYYLHSKRIDVSEETKIRATKEETDEYYGGAMKTDTKPNFISDIFFILNSIFHLGLIKTIDTRSKAEKNITQMEDELKKLEGRSAEWANVSVFHCNGADSPRIPPLRRRARLLSRSSRSVTTIRTGADKVQADIGILHASIHTYDTQLLDPAFTRLNVTFCGFLMSWMLRMVDPRHQHPQTPIS